MYYDTLGDMRVAITGGTVEERKTLASVIHRSLRDEGFVGAALIDAKGHKSEELPEEHRSIYQVVFEEAPRLHTADIGIDPSPDPYWQPQQPFALDEAGVLRYRRNALVGYLVDHGNIDLNTLGVVAAPLQDQQQFEQLIGYSVSGYGDLQCSPYSQAAHDKEPDSMYGKLPKMLDAQYKAGKRGLID